ncbi:MAG TPA: tyrosine-protein phosphatase [Micromonosporaceae bacterium]|nr:tyrosine-protein phosphatase [Micromonosporaceae bacterium]
MSDRRVLPERLANVRDVGGLRTVDGRTLRRGRLVRCSALSTLDDAALDLLAGELPGAVYVDLRTDAEVARDGAPDGLCARGWRWRRMPVQDKEPGDTSDLAEDMLRRQEAALPRCLEVARAVAELLRGSPVALGCTLGKDRTGLVVLVLLRWLGVHREDIVEDFMLSNTCLPGQRHLLPPSWSDPDRPITPVLTLACTAMLDALDRTDPDPTAAAPAAALRSSLLGEVTHAS